jgi:hypothetical protein
MNDYLLYFKKCPGVTEVKHIKVGIAKLLAARTRLATYQSAVGPVWEESFLRVWLGDENHIRLAETQFKRHFKDRISSSEAGLSEWICDISIDELLAFVTELREEYFLKFVDCPEQFLPLTMPLCEDLAEWYNELETTVEPILLENPARSAAR